MSYPASLHNHTDFSNINCKDAICTYQDLIDYAIGIGHKGIAITDHECLSNAIQVLDYRDKIDNPDFKIVLGNEIYLCRNDLNSQNFTKGQDRFWHYILLAKNAEGHKQIREISARAWERSWKTGKMRRRPTYYQDLIDIIYPNQGNVIGCTACLGGWLASKCLELSQNYAEKLEQEIENWLSQMVELFGKGNFYIELQPPAKKDNEQYQANYKMLEFAKKLNIPWIISTDSHYLRAEDREIHKAYLASQPGEREVDAFYATTYLMTTEELEEHFDFPLEEGYKNIQKILDSCENYDLRKPLKIPHLIWKEFHPQSNLLDWKECFPTIEKFINSSEIADKELAKAIVEKLEKEPKLQDKKVYDMIEDNLDKIWESSLVNKASWSAYLLNLQRIIDCCWDAGSIVLPARGSGGGFILLYLLDIIQMNPAWESAPLKSWRFLNPSRVSVLDVDFDIEGGKRTVVMNKFREVYGNNRVCNVATFGHEKSKAAIKTAARGLGMSVEDADYLSSLIPSDRGIQRSLHQCYYGDPDNDMKPVSQFVSTMKQHPKVWEVAQKIENLVCQLGQHAGGVVFFDEDITNTAGIMRTPEGTIVSCYELHDLEKISAIKYDCLSVEAADKMHCCLDLLIKDNVIQAEPTLKETYMKYLDIYKIDRDDQKMWDMVNKGQIYSLFQMEKQSGIQGIRLTHPRSIEDLAHLNSIIRLMAAEKGAETPLEKWARFKKDITLWYAEMDTWGLTKEEQKILEPLLLPSYGICESQELFMTLVQLPEAGGFDLNWADSLRKVIAKKVGGGFEKLEKEYFKKVEEKGLNQNFCNYVWKVLVATSRGYGFNLSHTLAYSLVALQEMHLACHFPTIYWNTACLIVNSGSLEDNSTEEIVDIYEPEAEDLADGVTFIDLPDKSGKIRKTASTDYNKVAQALGATMKAGISVSLVDINYSGFGFVPDIKNNQILFGMKSLLGISDDIINTIISNRPYTSPKDFIQKVQPKKSQMISLIKAGAFDSMIDRRICMAWYLWEVCDKKQRLTLQNMPGLLKYDLVPTDTEERKLALRVYNFNRYLKAITKQDKCAYKGLYTLDERAIAFLQELGLDDMMTSDNLAWFIDCKAWDKIYQKYMDTFRDWLSAEKGSVLEELNSLIFKDEWEKYAKGTISAWEMEVMCFYYHEHELAHLNTEKYGISNYFNLSEEPIVERSFFKGGKQINLFKLDKIAGTVIAKNKTKSSISLLTTAGVVEVSFRKEYFSLFDRQISEKLPDGSKRVIEKSWFARGSMIVVQGMRSGDRFIAKNYSSSGGHTLYKINEVMPDGEVVLQIERVLSDE